MLEMCLFTSCILYVDACICLAHTIGRSSSFHYLFSHLLCAVHPFAHKYFDICIIAKCIVPHTHAHTKKRTKHVSLHPTACHPHDFSLPISVCVCVFVTFENLIRSPAVRASRIVLVLGSKWPTIRKLVLSACRSFNPNRIPSLKRHKTESNVWRAIVIFCTDVCIDTGENNDEEEMLLFYAL